MRAFLSALIALTFSALAPLEVHAEKRVALVVGNSEYSLISPLQNPRNDAELMAQTLKGLGFDVVLALDSDRTAMTRAVREFGKRLSEAGPGTAGLFYYAGHGVQARGTNYLVPLKAPIEDELDLTVEAVDVAWVLSQMEAAGNGLNLMVLDACRNNPFKGMFRSVGRGLGRIDTARGALVAFAAAPGQVATDGTGDNSPYTASLVRAMRTPGLAVEQVFKRVRLDVESKTGGRQTPWEESSLRGEFYFVPEETVKTEPAAGGDRLAANRLGAKQSPAFDEQTIELTFWNSVKDSADPAVLGTYLNRYPNGVFADLARVLIAQLERSGQDSTSGQRDTSPAAPIQTAREASKAESEPAAGTRDATAPAAAPETEQKVAAVDPQAVTAPQTTEVPDLARRIQSVLARAGCRPGGVDGLWGRNSEAALKRFGRHAKLRLPSDAVSDETLDLLLKHPGRVCPGAACGPGHSLKNGRCVARTCPRGQFLTRSGACQPRARQVSKPRPPKARPAPQRTAPQQAPPRKRRYDPAESQGEGWQIQR
ncbi:MAG: caspase family protein [Hyphomicrobiales bacterium]